MDGTMTHRKGNKKVDVCVWGGLFIAQGEIAEIRGKGFGWACCKNEELNM